MDSCLDCFIKVYVLLLKFDFFEFFFFFVVDDFFFFVKLVGYWDVKYYNGMFVFLYYYD